MLKVASWGQFVDFADESDHGLRTSFKTLRESSIEMEPNVSCLNKFYTFAKSLTKSSALNKDSLDSSSQRPNQICFKFNAKARYSKSDFAKTGRNTRCMHCGMYIGPEDAVSHWCQTDP